MASDLLIDLAPALDDVAVSVARTFNAYNITTLVYTGGLVLGIVFIVTALALYAYYYAIPDNVNNGRSSRRGFDNTDRLFTDDFYSSYSFVSVLEEIEASLQQWGVKRNEEECQKRLLCEAFLPGATVKSEAFVQDVSSALRRVTPERVQELGPNSVERGRLRALIEAAESGRRKKNCLELELNCPFRSLEALSKQQG